MLVDGFDRRTADESTGNVDVAVAASNVQRRLARVCRELRLRSGTKERARGGERAREACQVQGRVRVLVARVGRRTRRRK